MESGQFRQRWLAACVAAGLLANLVGGFSIAVTVVFLAIYLTGAALIGHGEPDATAADEPLDVEGDGEPADDAAVPYPDEPAADEQAAAKSP